MVRGGYQTIWITLKWVIISLVLLFNSSLQGFDIIDGETWSLLSEKNDYVQINRVTVEKIPQWKVHYETSQNGEPANTIVGMKIKVTRINNLADVTFTPMVKVIVDRNKVRNERMLMAAYKGEFQHYVDICLCWKNLFTPFATRFVGTSQDINLVKKVCIDYFHSKMNQTRIFWDESGHHDVNAWGFEHQPSKAEIDNYRLHAYGAVFPYNADVKICVKSEDSENSSKSEI